ncbi:MAG: ribulokinase [Ignavibacteriales bacterium]|nr:ribulokinase [Ignavibacteriales bacterium]
MSEKTNLLGLGIDFGTNSVRALILDLITGKELATSVSNYKSGEVGILLDKNDPVLARQNPADYLESMEISVRETVNKIKELGINVENIAGIGVDTTGSTPIPVDENMIPLAMKPEFKENLNAHAWLWKDHTSINESIQITELAAEMRPDFIAKCGGAYSSEWFFSKILHCLNVDKKVFDSAATWVECSDFIPAALAGVNNINDLKRNICAAGHKAMYSDDWNGYPDEEFLARLSPELVRLRKTLEKQAYTIDELAGNLSKEWAEKFGLKENIPIAIGAMDAHLGAIGSGVGKGTLVKIIGTSTCDIMVEDISSNIKPIPGVAGFVDHSVIPNYVGIEAGQSAVGDIFNWYITKVLKKDFSYFDTLTEKAQELKAGQSGLLSLDWNNGNRTILADFNLSGLILGQTLHTTDYEIYRALIEATAFGALKIIERIEEYGVQIKKVVNCGGIAEKNPLVMQIYADVTNRPMEVAESSQTVAMGSAIVGGWAGAKGTEGFENIEEIQQRVCKVKEKVYYPNADEAKVYAKIYKLYSKLHDSFGLKNHSSNLYDVMKELIEIKKNVIGN